MEKILIIRSAPFANMAYAVKSLKKDYGNLNVTALAQPEVAETLDQHLGVDDFVLYKQKFLKLYYLIFLLPHVIGHKFEAVVMFYNNEARKGYRHAELFCLLTLIPYIILCNEDGSRDVLTRGQFFSQVILSGFIRIVSNIVAFCLFMFIFAVLGLLSLLLKPFEIFKK